MDYNTAYNLEACRVVVDQVTRILYYSHIPTAIVALVVGCFVFFKSKRSLAGGILLFISILFSIWSVLDLIIWVNYDKNSLIMFTWSLLGIITSLIFILSLYFFYVFIDKKDISLTKKIILGFFIVPIIVLTPTKFNLINFNAVDCAATEGEYFTNYYYLLGLFIFILIIVISAMRYKKVDHQKRKELVILTLGIEFFLFAFFFTGFISSLLTNWGLEQYTLEQYGLFGMPIFLAFLGYLIVQYKAFDIKLLGAQALVIALVILTGSQFFFIQTNANRILTGITLVLVATFGWFLIKSVKLEVKRKEELQIMTDRLAQANDQLRKLDNAKSEFISIASHQLRTPLTAIKGFISLIMEGSYGKTTPQLKDTLNKVYISNERLITLVEDMLNLSRIESGRMEYTFEKVKMEEVCQEVFDTFVIRAREKGLKFELKFPEKPISEATTDRSKIREVISNLVDNAIKYTPKGWVYLRLSQNGAFVRVAVSDTGIGVPKDEMPYLFEKFSRGKDINRLNTGGTGLGLHVGKRIIEALHGKLDLKSEGAGKGSTFYVEVPVEAKEK